MPFCVLLEWSLWTLADLLAQLLGSTDFLGNADLFIGLLGQRSLLDAILAKPVKYHLAGSGIIITELHHFYFVLGGSA